MVCPCLTRGWSTDVSIVIMVVWLVQIVKESSCIESDHHWPPRSLTPLSDTNRVCIHVCVCWGGYQTGHRVFEQRYTAFFFSLCLCLCLCHILSPSFCLNLSSSLILYCLCSVCLCLPPLSLSHTICVCVCVYVCVCVCLSLCLSLSLTVSLSLSLCISLCVCLPVFCTLTRQTTCLQALQLAPATIPEAVNPNIIVQQPMVSMATVNPNDLDPGLVQSSTVSAVSMQQAHDPNSVATATYVTTPMSEDVQVSYGFEMDWNWGMRRRRRRWIEMSDILLVRLIL